MKELVLGRMQWDELIRKYHTSKTIGAKRRIKAQQELDKLYENYDTRII